MTAASSRSSKKKPVIGWREWASFPDFDVRSVNAKIDTGAKTSAIHAFRISPFLKNGATWVEFYLHPLQQRRKPEIYCQAPVADIREIRSSNGYVQERYVIRTRLNMGEMSWRIDLSLANRDAMGFRLLLGRDALGKRFLIDPGASYKLGKARHNR
ncbi:MAG: ATP-dependent zinc protease family protein [Hyphococcus sp.]